MKNTRHLYLIKENDCDDEYKNLLARSSSYFPFVTIEGKKRELDIYLRVQQMPNAI
jgi:hypothetical protein